MRSVPLFYFYDKNRNVFSIKKYEVVTRSTVIIHSRSACHPRNPPISHLWQLEHPWCHVTRDPWPAIQPTTNSPPSPGWWTVVIGRMASGNRSESSGHWSRMVWSLDAGRETSGYMTSWMSELSKMTDGCENCRSDTLTRYGWLLLTLNIKLIRLS